MKKVFCHYANAWIPLGRARARCPKCGAAFLEVSSHPVEEMEADEKRAIRKAPIFKKQVKEAFEGEKK